MIFLWFKWVLTIKMFCLINNKQVPRQMNVLNIYSFNPDSPFWLHVENFPFSATVWVFWPFCGQMRSSSLSTVHPPPPPPPFRLSPSVCWVSRFFFFGWRIAPNIMFRHSAEITPFYPLQQTRLTSVVFRGKSLLPDKNHVSCSKFYLLFQSLDADLN